MTTVSNPSASPRLLDIQEDRRVNCWSVMVSLSIDEYLSIANEAYKQRGGIRHQRDSIKTTSARRIRNRLVEDLRNGAIIPPIVIGMVISGYNPEESLKSGAGIVDLLKRHQSDISIIDGMQRTTALLEAMEGAEIGSRPLRVEIWIAASADSLIYRMLVLNTGQIPWNLKQQLNVVFEPLIKAIEEKVRFTRILKRKDGKVERRWNGGELAAEDLVEAYIAFGLRRTEVDTQEHLADEFSRLDMADALSSRKYDRYFYPVVQMMVDIDVALSRFNPERQEGDGQANDENGDMSSGRSQKKTYTRGRHIFDTQPSRVGFIVAAATAILGRIGMDRSEEESVSKLTHFESMCATLVARIEQMGNEELESFLALGVLSEVLMRRPTSAVGRWERNFFENSFKVLFDVDFQVPNLEACWRA